MFSNYIEMSLPNSQRLYAEIAKELLPIIQANDYSFRIHFYRQDGKFIYIENDILNKSVHINYIGFHYPFPIESSSRCSIERLTEGFLTEMIRYAYMIRQFIKTKSNGDKIQAIVNRVEEINKLI